jgi:hypothetical protein
MLEKRTVADFVATAGLCLLALAAIDGAMELFEYLTAINLWMTCGTIGLLLLVVVNVAVGIFEPESSLRRGIRRVVAWYKLRVSKRAEAHGDVPLTNDASLAGMR